MARSYPYVALLALTTLGAPSCGTGEPADPTELDVTAVANAADYAGEYTRTDGTPIYIVPHDGGLAVVVTGNVFALEPAGEDRFDLVGVSESVAFERDGEGDVVAVADSQGDYPRAGDDVPAEVTAMFGGGEVPDYTYAPPADAAADLPVGRAEDVGLPTDSIAAIVQDIYADPEYRRVHSLLVQRGGQLVVEEYFAGFDRARPHNLRSATKSVISALAGTAVLRGEVALDDRPLAAIAEAAGLQISAHKAQLTLADMLDMRHGLQCDDWSEDSPGNERLIYGEPDWTAFILGIPDAEDGAAPATYCSAMPLMVGRYLELATGEPLAELADARLFGPLGIARDAWTWDFDLSAKPEVHGAQVHLRPRDMLRFGALYARGGVTSDGERVLPEGWVQESLTAEMPLGDWRRYNDFWWAYDVEVPGREPVTIHMASGVGGQRIALVPARELVIVLTGGSFSQGRGGPTRIIERVVLAAG